MKKLPVGILTFSKIIEDDYLYIDKTEIACSLIERYQYIFCRAHGDLARVCFLIR